MGCSVTPGKLPHPWRPMSGASPPVILAVVAVALLCACDFLGELTDPVSLSTASFQGVVVDSTFGAALRDARVEIDGKETLTDSAGRFSFEHAATGDAEIRVAAAGYRPLAATTSIPLTGRIDTLRLARINRPPIISTTRSCLPFLSTTLRAAWIRP
jgi:hypothetical protein